MNDFDWISEISELDHVLNKAFHFDPVAKGDDSDYETLIKTLVGLGFESEYDTPMFLTGRESVAGLFSYRDKDGNLKFVYTSVGGDDYLEHIKDFASDESIGGDIALVDAREFVR